LFVLPTGPARLIRCRSGTWKIWSTPQDPAAQAAEAAAGW